MSYITDMSGLEEGNGEPEKQPEVIKPQEKYNNRKHFKITLF